MDAHDSRFQLIDADAWRRLEPDGKSVIAATDALEVDVCHDGGISDLRKCFFGSTNAHSHDRRSDHRPEPSAKIPRAHGDARELTLFRRRHNRNEHLRGFRTLQPYSLVSKSEDDARTHVTLRRPHP